MGFFTIMKDMMVKDLMVPLEEYATVDEDATLYEAYIALEEAQEALDLDTTETLVTVVLGWFAILIITAIVTSVIGIGSAGLGAVLSNFGG